MITSKTQAKDDILTVYKAVADAESIYSIYPNTDKAIPEPGTEPVWAKLVIRDNTKDRKSVGNANGKIRYKADGLLTIELFTKFGEGTEESDRISDLIEDVYRGTRTPGGVLFRNPVTVPAGNDTNWYKVTILVQYYYDIIK